MERYAIESLPPPFEPDTDDYIEGIRHSHGIADSAQGQEARDQVHAVWQSSLTDPDGLSIRIELMEILMGDRVDGSEQGSLGYLGLHLVQPETFEKFIRGVARAKGWLEEDRAAAPEER